MTRIFERHRAREFAGDIAGGAQPQSAVTSLLTEESSMTRRALLVSSTVAVAALSLGVLLAQPRVAWELARIVAVKQQRAGAAIHSPALTAKLQAYLDSDPTPTRARKALRAYFSLLDKDGATQKDLRALISHPDRQISAMAQAKVHRLTLMSEPVELRFKALDGRVVDLRELRDKVVLLEFWAAWCGSCIKELPILKSVYDKYHDQGFEIVGIALDDAEDEQELIQLLKDKDLPWPQYFGGDGHYTTSAISKRFGVTGIPATFLLDRQGMIAEFDVRGERLEPAVRSLLAQRRLAGGEAAGAH